MDDLENYIADIKRALESDAVLSALALALALPDICKTMEFADPTKPTTAKTYTAWARAHLMTQGTITPEHLYAIRCAYLHNGGGEMARQRSRGTLSSFKLTWDRDGNAYRVGLGPDYAPIQHEIGGPPDIICHLIIHATRHWMALHATNPTVISNLKSLFSPPKP